MRRTQKRTKRSALLGLGLSRTVFWRLKKMDATDWSALPLLLTIRTTARLLRVHPNTLRDWDRSGYLRAVRIGARRDRRYERSAVQMLAAARTANAAFFRSALGERKERPRFALRLAAGVAVLAGFSMLALGAGASESTLREYRLQPATCTGWYRAANAATIELPPLATRDDFTEHNAALYRADQYAVTANPDGKNVVTGTLDAAAAAALTCEHFAAPNLPSDGDVSGSKLALSFAVTTAPNTTDVFLLEGSTNGSEWFPLATFPQQEDGTNYHILSLPQVTTVEQFADLHIRMTADAQSYDPATHATLDGIALITNIAVEQPSSPSENIRQRAQRQLDTLVSFSQDVYQVSEQPVVTVPKERTKRFLFFNRGDEQWSLEKVSVADAGGRTLDPPYHTQIETNGDAVDETLTIDTRTLHPGKYTVNVTLRTPAGTSETVTKEFLWGVVALNLHRALPRTGDEQAVSMAVLDDEGHTICDANISLTVTDPRGRKERYRTSDGSVATSGVCVDKGVTNLPDYSATFKADLPGVYHIRMDAETKAGKRSEETNFEVSAAQQFDVARIDFPTRIYPLAEYDVRLAVTPLRDFMGVVRERVESSVSVSKPQPEATIQPSPDNPNEQFIDWLVEWKAGETYFLSYTFDAPDISPELFLLGPLTIDGSFTEAPLFSENRQWQLASDSVGAAVSQHPYESGFELQSVTAGVEWTTITGSPVIDTTTVRSGSAALRVQVTGSAATENVSTVYGSETQDDFYFRTYVRIATSVNTQTRILAAQDNAGTWDFASLRLNTDDTLAFYLEDSDANIQIGSNSAALSKNTWYRLELRFDTNNLTAIVMDARIDGVSFASSSGVYSSTGSAVSVAVGFITTAATGDVYFDDVSVTNDAGGSPENWPGEGKIVHLHPSAAGDTQTCDANTFAVVDEVTPNDATDYITCDVNNDVAEFNVEDTSVAGINANDIINYVATGNRIRRATAASGSNTARLRVPNGNALSSGTVNTSSLTAWKTNASASPTNRLRAFDQTDTTDNDPITPADVDNTQIGIISADADPDTWVSTMWLLVEYVPAPGGRLYSSGFELQDVTNSGVEWATVAGTLAISTSVKHGGAASVTVGSLGSGTEESVEQDFVAANDNGPFWGRVYLNVATLPSAENRIIEYQNSTNTVLLYITLSSTGTLALYDEDGQVGSASRALTTSVWYRVEFKLDATGAGAADTIEGKINGETFATSATRNLSTGITSLVIGGNLNGEAQTTGTWNMDDVAVNKNAGSVQNGYPGAGFITHLRPNATGDNSAWTNANTEIDEVTPDDGTTVISSSTADQIEDVNLDSTSTGGIGASDTINLVSVGFRFALDSGTTQSDVAVRIRENTNNPSIEGPRWPVTTTTWQTNSSSTPRLPSLTLYDEPLQNTAWSTTDLDTTQIGVRLATDGSTANIQVTALWLLVDYTSKVTIQGNAYSDEGSTAIDGSAANKTVNLLINGFGSDTDEITASTGAWDVQNLTIISGDIITVYLDGETEKAATIYVSDGTAKSDVHLFQNRLVVRADTGSITNANIGTGDNTDTDVPVSVSSSNLTVDSGFELHVYTSDTYAPGGTVTTNATGGLFHLDDSAAVTLANATNSIGTDVTIDTGATLTVNADTVVAGGDMTATGTLTTSSGTPTITMRGTGNISGAGTKTIFNLTIGDGTTATTTLTGAATVNNDVSVATGSTFNVNADISAAGGDFTNTGTGVINTTSGTPTVTVSGTGSIGGVSGSTTFYNLILSGTPTFGANFTVNNNLTLPASVTAGSTTVTMAGTSGTLVGGGATIYALTIDPSSAGTITLNTSDLTVSNTLTVAASDALTLSSGRTMTLSGTSGTTLSLSGTINGPGRLTYRSSTTFPTGGTLASTLIVRYDTVSTDMTTAVRTDYGAIEAFNSSSTNRVLTIGNGTHTLSGNLDLQTTGTGTLTFATDTNNPAVNVTGNVTASAANGAITVSMGSGTWTVSGNVDLTNVTTFNHNSGTLVMNGTTKTFTSNSLTLNNVTLSGTITLANATHTVAGNLNLSGTITAGTSTVTMTGTSKTIDGGGNTLANLTISGTETLQNTDLTVNTLLTVDTSKSLTINSGRTITLSRNSATNSLTLNGTLNGPGRLTYQNATANAFPTGGTLAATLIVRFDTVNGNLNIPARTDYGAIEAFGGSANARTVTLGTAGSQTITTSSYLYVIADSTSGNNVTLQGATYDPTLNVGGDFDFTGTQAATEIITAPDAAATWTVSGNVNLTDGTYTTSAETLVMNGTANLVGAGQTIANLTVNGSGNTVTVTTSDVSISGTLQIGGAADGNNDTLSIGSGRTVTSGTGGTTTFIASGTDTISGSGTLTVQNSNLDTDGALSSIVRFDATSGNITMPARTYGGLVEAYSNATDAGKTVTMGAGTHTLSGALNLLAANTQNLTLAGTTNDPTLNLTGDFTMSKPSTGTPVITAPDTGSVTWTLSGNADFTSGTYTKGTETLVMNGTTKTLTSNSNSLNNFEVSAGSVTMSGTTTVAGNLTISGGTLTAPSSGALNVAGNWNNSGGTFTDNSSTVTFNGSSQQTAQGTMTGSSDFNNLTITNASGSDPESSPSVIFSAAATVSGTFTATTASTKIRFAASATYTFVNVTLNGQATTTRVALRSSTSGTQWNLTSTGTQSVSNTDVKDSSACGGDTIDASDGTNLDSANNSCWDINSITLAISTNSIGFGTLSTTAATWANSAGTGSASDASAHTIQITSNARSGYALTYYGATLTSGGNTISAASITNDADGTPGSEQFGIGFSTDGNAAIADGYDHNATAGNRDWTFTPSSTTQVVSENGATATETISAFYLANIAPTTEPGSYSTTLTYVLSGTY